MTIRSGAGGGKVLLGTAAALFLLIGPILMVLVPLLMISAMFYDPNELRDAGQRIYAGAGYRYGVVSKLRGALAWREQAVMIGEELGVDPNLILAIIAQESGGDPSAISPAGAIGLMQLMPDTARALGVNPYDALDNIRGGALYIRDMLRRYDNNLDEALAAYNAGPGRVKKGGGVPLIAETMDYVVKVKYYKQLLESSAVQAVVNSGAPGQWGIVLDYAMGVFHEHPGGPCAPGVKPLMPASGWENPVPGFPRTDGYGLRINPITGRWQCHYGIDIATPVGTPVRAAADGRVAVVAWHFGYGNILILDHGGGVYSFYAHLQRVNAHPGEKLIKRGEIIAYTGNTGSWTTGPHLHFEIHVYENGRVRTYDPEDYIGAL